MKILVTGSAGHLGEALLRTLQSAQHPAVGLDLMASPFTHYVGSIIERDFVKHCMRGVQAVVHTATLHKPHVATHTRQQFIDTNITGTLNLLEEAVAAGVKRFIYTSTTSAFGLALQPVTGAPAAWITEQVVPIPKNVYGVTKVAAENLCQLFHQRFALPCVVLRTARFFPEPDDDARVRQCYHDDNAKLNELLYRRVDIEDVVSAHLLALRCAPRLGFDNLVISATTPFAAADLQRLRQDAVGVVQDLFPACSEQYRQRGWSLPDSIERVYVNERARLQLGWRPQIDFGYALSQLAAGADYRSALARAVGSKGYHATRFADGPYPTE